MVVVDAVVVRFFTVVVGGAVLEDVDEIVDDDVNSQA